MNVVENGTVTKKTILLNLYHRYHEPNTGEHSELVK